MWLTQLWPYMRIWIQRLYKDLYSIPASLFSVNLSDWSNILQALDSSLKFSHQPIHSGMPIGGTLVSVGHYSVSSLSDVHNVRLKNRIWLRIRDPNSSRRKLSDDSFRIVKLFQDWILGLQPVCTLRPKPYWAGARSSRCHGLRTYRSDWRSCNRPPGKLEMVF